MDKLVYLYELDSVHTSSQEILRGQQALFEETVLNGNQVVLTFNQLTDSQAFLCAIRNPKTYPQILELFRLGVLKISRFAPPGSGDSLDQEGREKLCGQVQHCREQYADLFQDGVLKSYPPLPSDAPQRVLRTASHYIQNAVEKCRNDDKGSFLFSALPFRSKDKTILAALSYALQYSDPSVLDTCSFYFSEEDGPDGMEKARERQDYVKRYVEMILQLSQEPLAANPEKTEERIFFTDMLQRILSLSLPPREEDETASLLPQAFEILKGIQASFGADRSVNNRSNWHTRLLTMDQEPSVRLAEAVVDLCYNYTMEASISGVARHYWDDASFREDFLCRLRLYWVDYRQREPIKDSRTLPLSQPLKLPPWDVAARLLKNTAKKEGVQTEVCYGSADAKEKRVWYRHIGLALLKQVGAALVYSLLFWGTSLALDALEDRLSEMGTQFQINGLAQSAINVFLFGLLGSLLSAAIHLPDILETFQALCFTVLDGIRLLLAPRHVAYFIG